MGIYFFWRVDVVEGEVMGRLVVFLVKKSFKVSCIYIGRLVGSSDLFVFYGVEY